MGLIKIVTITHEHNQTLETIFETIKLALQTGLYHLRLSLRGDRSSTPAQHLLGQGQRP